MTLHEAIIKVLWDSKKPLKASRISEIINADKLYGRSDGQDIPAQQIFARIANHPDYFENIDGLIQLKPGINFQQLEFERFYKGVIDDLFKELPIDLVGILSHLPFLFFIKRLHDNPDLQPIDNSFNGEEFSLNLYLNSLIELNQNHKNFAGLFKVIISSVDEIDINEFNKIILKISNYDLTEANISIEHFSKCFIDLIWRVEEEKLKAGEFITPRSVGDLIAKLVLLEKHHSIYNPCAGIGTLPVLIANASKKAGDYYGEEINVRTYLLLLCNLIINRIDTANFECGNSLLRSWKESFTGDVIIANLPFGGKTSITTQQSVFNTSDNLFISLIQKIIASLDHFERAILIVPESFLFVKNKYYAEIRRYLIKHQLIEGIISLPVGSYLPLSGIKVSILIINNNRKQGFSYLVDAEDKIYWSKNRNGRIELEIDAIIDSIIKAKQSAIYSSESISVAEEPHSKYGTKGFGLKKISIEGDELNVARHLHFFEETNEKLSNTRQLGDICEFNTARNFHNYNANEYKYVSIKDLNSEYFKLNLDAKNLPLRVQSKERLLNHSSILIGSISGSYKPTYFNFGGSPVILSSNVYDIRLKTEFSDKVSYEYLVYELSSPFVRDQLEKFSSGVTSLRSINIRDLKRILVRLPDLEEQKKNIRAKKEAIIASRIEEVSKLGETIGLAIKPEKEILAFVNHEIGNILGGISNDFKSLKGFINRNNIDLESKINDLDKASSLGLVFDRLQENISDINEIMRNFQHIIDITESRINPESLLLRKTISQEIKKLENLLYQVKVWIGIDDDFSNASEKIIEFDKKQFSILIRNFITNSIKHGFSENRINKNLVFNINQDQDYIYISLINDGYSFPPGFDIIDFKRLGGRFDSGKGSGLGGYLMDKIVENHNATLELAETGKIIKINLKSGDKRADYEKRVLIETGVHFLIKIPLIQS